MENRDADSERAIIISAVKLKNKIDSTQAGKRTRSVFEDWSHFSCPENPDSSGNILRSCRTNTTNSTRPGGIF